MTGGGTLWVTEQYLANPITKINSTDQKRQSCCSWK